MSVVANKNIKIQDSNTTLENLTYDYVVDEGSNANGSWIKYNNGTMICYGRKSYLGTQVNVKLDSLYNSTNLQITYPQTFIDIPSCKLDLEQNITTNHSCWITKVSPFGTTTKSYGFYISALVQMTPSSPYGFYVDYQAIGKWK